ncbi:MAG: DHH family phosphoesterase [Methanobrevibacter wolinii]|nr:DHH family phosphoesterase [Methanobrevibacter wolinii]MDD5960609.1 DHH family phosphoesterase [Methanobrevibacter wolinii]
MINGVAETMEDLPSEMKDLYKKAKDIILENDDIMIYSHTDCDGISSGAILTTILERIGKDYDIDFVSLDKLEDLPIDHTLTIFSDLGSGQPVEKNATEDSNIIILDHHPPLRDKNYRNTADCNFLEINPMHYGINGTYYICGGGLCYYLAKEFGFDDLSWIGVLSAVGDMQNTHTGKMEGLNKLILQDAIDNGLVKRNSDLSLYGRETRPLYVALSYFSDVNLPITNSKTECIALLDELDIPRKKDCIEVLNDSIVPAEYKQECESVLIELGIEHKSVSDCVSIIEESDISDDIKDDCLTVLRSLGDRFRTLADLTNSEKSRLFSALVKMLSREVPGKYVKYIPKLVAADTFEFLKEEDHTFLRDAAEFSTAMNACVRNNEDFVALEILKGNRDVALDKLEVISRNHRRYLATHIQLIPDMDALVQMDNIQYFDGTNLSTPEDKGSGIRTTVIGTITGMVLSYGDWRKPILGFVPLEDNPNILKISLRCSRLLAYDGVHFGNIIREVARSLGGNGGGHAVACGAYIPIEYKDEFLNDFNEMLYGKL